MKFSTDLVGFVHPGEDSVSSSIPPNQTSAFSVSNTYTVGSQRWLFQEFETHYQDKVVVSNEWSAELMLLLSVTLWQLSDAVTGAEFSQEGLHGYLLAVSNDGGSVSLFDTRKLLSESLISGGCSS